MNLEDNLNQILQTGVHIVLVIILRWLLIRVVKKYARKSEKVEHRTGLIIKYVDFASIFMFFLGLFLIWGVGINDLGWVMSSVFAVIGIGFFAQWSILSNITSGVIMFFTFPYKIGDYIIIHDKDFPGAGTIEDIRTFHVLIKTLEGQQITYPNSLMLQKGVSVIKPDDLDSFIKETDKNLEDQAED